MKILSLHPLASLGLFGAGLVTAGVNLQPQQDTDALEARVARAEASIAALTAGHAKLEAEVDALREYAKGDAQRADALLASLSRTEDLGFTAGINFESREELLAGFREYLKETKQGLRSLGGDAEQAKGEQPPARR